MKVKDKLALGRFIATRQAPYLTSAVMSMAYKEVPGLGAKLGTHPTMATTARGVCYYDPLAIEKWTKEEIGAAITHEVMHLLRSHCERAQTSGFEPRRANRAGDLEINDDLIAMGLKLPGNPLLPKGHDFEEGLTMEAYYHLLKEEEQKANQQTPNGTTSGQGGEGQEGPGDKGACGEGACGSCAGGPPSPGEDPNEGRSDVELRQVQRQVAEAIQHHASKSRGSVPGGLQRWAGEMLKPPRIPWQRKLARLVRAGMAATAGAVDHTFRRISRRQAGVGFGVGKPVIPAHQAYQPEVAIVVDTSGSMGEAELASAMREVGGVVRAAGGRATFLACDAAVHVLQPIRDWRQAVSLLKGGGGTDFRPAFEALANQRRTPHLCVFLTDGYGPAPLEAPPFRTVWVLIGGNTSAPAPWGEAVVVEED